MTQWRPYALVTADRDAAAPTWHLARLDDAPAGIGVASPNDFFQCDIGLDNELHVAYERRPHPEPNELTKKTSGRPGHLFHVRQVGGANLG